jgi:hypothetical protein
MRTAYLTSDEVNQDLALQIAAGCATKLCVMWPKEQGLDEDFDAVIYDLDWHPELPTAEASGRPRGRVSRPQKRAKRTEQTKAN